MKILLTISIILIKVCAIGQTLMKDTTISINLTTFTFKEYVNDEGMAFIKLLKNNKIEFIDTIQIVGPGGGSEVVDFNKDGYNDYLITFIGNVPISELYMFDSVSLTFKKVDNFNYFPEPKPLNVNPIYFYSYHRAGCADANWVSDLFYIDDFKAIQIGHIYGEGCGTDEEQRIEISKVVTLDKVFLLETLPIDTIGEYENYRWGFIEEYWNKNIEKFKK